MASDRNSVDIDLLKKAYEATNPGLGVGGPPTGADGSPYTNWDEFTALVNKFNAVWEASSSRFFGGDQSGIPNVQALLIRWAATDFEAKALYDVLKVHGGGRIYYQDSWTMDYLGSLGVERPEINVDPGEMLGLPRTSGYADDPVCTANGNFVHQETDIELVGFATLIEPTRTYNALAAQRPGVFGLGWSSLLDVQLTEFGSDLVRVRLVDGADVPFHRDPESGEFRKNGKRGLSLMRLAGDNGSGGWRLTSDDESWTFDQEGRLTAGSKDYASFEVERADGQVGFTENLSGRWIRYFIGSEGLADRVVSSDGREARLSYDDNGHCVEVERPSGSMTYEVADERIVSITDADGVILVRNVYDDDGRVLSQVNEHGRTSNYEYPSDGMTRLTYGDDGPTNLYTHDDRGNLTAVFGGDGAAQRMWWDDQGRLVRIVERGGPETKYEFATDHPVAHRDFLVRRIDPDELEETYEYDDAGRVIVETGRDGVVQRYEYDGDNTVPSRIIDADGTEMVATYNDYELPLTIRDADGVETQMMWDGDGQLVAVISATGARSSLIYDQAGRLARITDPMGRERSFRYDDGGRLVSTTEPDGLTTAYTYSAAGRALTCSTDGPGSWTASYSDAGLVDAFTDAAGASSSFTYDDFGQLLAQTDPTGATFQRELDSLGRLLAVIDSLGATTRYEYGPTGDLAVVEDADGHRWSREVDVMGRTASVTSPGGRATQWTYHPNGEIASVIDPAGQTTTYDIDDQGRLTREVGPDGGAITYTYSAGGRLTSVTTAAGREYLFTNDATGRMVEFIDPDGETVTANYRPDGQISEFVAEGSTTSIRYDDVGRVIGWSASDVGEGPQAAFSPNASEVTKAGANPARFNFDTRGLLSSVADPTGVVTEFVSDLRGFVTQVNTGTSTSAFTYDAAGNLETATDPLGVETRFRFTPTGRVEAISIGDELGLGYAYDNDGNVTAVSSSDDVELVTYRYDERGDMSEATTADGAVSLGRDEAGRLIETVDLDGRTTTYTRDADGMVVARTDPDGNTVTYRRSESGEIIGFIDPEAGEIEASRDPSDRTRDAGGRILADGRGRTYRYDTAGRLEEATNAAGERWAFTYNDYGLLATDETPGFGRRTFTYNEAGAVEQVTNTDGSTIGFAYDLAGRRIGERHSDGSAVDYIWDDLDQLIRITRTDAQGEASTTEVIYSGLGRVERVGDLDIQWDDGMYGKPIAVGDNRFLRSGANTLAVGRSTEWDAGLDDDPFGMSSTDGATGIGYRGELTIDGLVFMGDRVYDPATRTFLSRDPLPQVAGEAAYISPYVYAFNDPVNYLDPTGRRPLMEEEFQEIKTEMEKSAWDKYGSTVVHGVLDVAGMVPVIGEVADGLNAALYLAEGDYAMAALSLAAMVPIVGGAAVAAKYGAKAVKHGNRARKTSRLFQKSRGISTSRTVKGAGDSSVALTRRQGVLLDHLPKDGSEILIPSKRVDIQDLGKLTAKTGDEFAMFRNQKHGKTLLVRGDNEGIPIDYKRGAKLRDQGFEFTAHSHPGPSSLVLKSSEADRKMLRVFGGESSIIVSSDGGIHKFEQFWLP